MNLCGLLLCLLLTAGLITGLHADEDNGDTPAGAEIVNAAEAAIDAEPEAPQKAPNLDLKEVAPIPLPAPALDQALAPEDASTPAPPAEPGEGEPLIILGAEVAPGTATRLAWSPANSISGLSQATPVLVINGKKPGPTLCLTAAIHGDELNGIEIIRRVIYDVDPQALSGKLIGVPIVNLQGFQRVSRYLPDRRDLNRYFPGNRSGSLASRVAHSLFTNVIRHCNYLIDIHTGSMLRNNLPQIRADLRQPEVLEFAEQFDDIAVIHSGGNSGMLRTAAAAKGIPTVTLEAGESMRIQEDHIQSGVSSINGLMDRLGMINTLFSWGEPKPIYYQSRWIRANRGGILSSQVELGSRVRFGQILGTIVDPITNEITEITATTDGRVIGMAIDQVVMPGFAAYHIGLDTGKRPPLDDEAGENMYELEENLVEEDVEMDPE